MLGVNIKKHLKFEEHIVKQCKKTGQNVSTLARVCNILNEEGQRTLMKAFKDSQFGYYPLIWMFCRRNLNNRIIHLHEMSLRITLMPQGIYRIR